MTYRKKAAAWSILTAALACIFILTLLSDFRARRGNSFAWFNPELLDLADRIEIRGLQGTALLVRRNNLWFFSAGTAELPVKQDRVDDLFAVLTRKESYIPRAVSDEARERLGLSGETASYIVIRGGAGLPLLELLVGRSDALGREVYLRRADRNEIYSGEDFFTYYIDSRPVSWFDLRLFPASPAAAMVQQADITLPGSKEPYILRRGGGILAETGGVSSESVRGWTLPGEGTPPELDSLKAEAWLRSVLSAAAEDFVPAASLGVVEGSVVLRFGDGTDRALFIGLADAEGYRNASVSGSALIYRIPEWTIGRLFRESSFFLAEGRPGESP